MSQPEQPTRSGFAIFTTYFFQGIMPACYDGSNFPVVFETELEAQREIADNQLTRIQEFLDGQRGFEDAIATEEFVLPVDVWPDGRISIEDGSVFGKLD
jgi:hypothetical protein